MRLSPKRLILIIYLSVCTFLSFVNYQYSNSADQRPDDQSIDHSAITHISSISTTIASDHRQNRSMTNSWWWNKLKRNFVQEIFAVLPMNMFLRTRAPGDQSKKEEDARSIIDRWALWPEESNRSDRIVAQMDLDYETIEMRMEEHIDRNDHSNRSSDAQRSIDRSIDTPNYGSKLIFLPSGLRAWSVDPDRSEFVKQGCRMSNCRLTDRKSDASRADAVVFRNHYVGGFERAHDRDQIWIYYTLESPENTPSLIALRDQINWTATYRFDSDLVTPYEKFRMFTEEELRNRSVHQKMMSAAPGRQRDASRLNMTVNPNYARSKTKQVVWFVSNCLTSNRRQEYAQMLARYIRVDIYGRCGPLKCSRNDPKCARMLDEDYRFYLAFENSNCRDYITEKFFVQGLQHNAIPIVMGARRSDYERAAPPHSFIHVDDFRGPRELAAYLHLLSRNETLYNEYFHWKRKGEFINTKFWCRLCAVLHAPKRKYYPNVEQWWHRSDVCTKGRWEMARNQTLNRVVEEELRRTGGGNLKNSNGTRSTSRTTGV